MTLDLTQKCFSHDILTDKFLQINCPFLHVEKLYLEVHLIVPMIIDITNLQLEILIY